MKRVLILIFILIIGFFFFETIKAATCGEERGKCMEATECKHFGGSCDPNLSSSCPQGCCCTIETEERGTTIEKWRCDLRFSFFTSGCGGRLAPECPPGRCEFEDLKELICNIVNFVVNCLAQIALMFGVSFGGFQIMFAGGDPSKIESGKKTIIGSIVGFLIVVLAGEIINLILNL